MKSFKTNYSSQRPKEGAEINLSDIVEYIELNKDFIDNPKIETTKISDLNVEKRIEILQNVKSGTLENLPTNLSAIFGSVNSFKRINSLHHVTLCPDADISYVSSILATLDDYSKLNLEEQINFVEAFIRKIAKDAKEQFVEFEYEKLGWNQKEFVSNVKSFTMGKDLLKYVADYLFINVFILDVVEDSLLYVGEKKFIKYKKNVFLLKFRDNWFEPILAPDRPFLLHDSSLIKKLINSRFLVERLDCDFTNEKEEFNFIVGQDDLTRFIVEPDKLETNAETEPEIITNPDLKIETKTKSNVVEDTIKTEKKVSKKTEPAKTVKAKAKAKPKFKYTSDYLNELSHIQLKDLAKEHSIDTTHEKNGRKIIKTKVLLIENLSTVRDTSCNDA